LRSHRRKDAVIGAATCGVTNGMQPVFDAGKEVERKEYIHGGGRRHGIFHNSAEA